ncbi:MAG: carboxypeptidase regulatory-like domain-containing protein, partial [Gemmatimonadaceae bacterium]
PALVAAGPGDSAGAPARRLRGSATIRGRVAGPDRRPVAGVRVTVEGTGAEATTDANGAFSIGELPAGTWTVLARRVGARPEQQVVSLPARSVKDVSLVLQPVTELAAVVVRDTVARGLQRVGFESRRSGGMGHYIGPDEIAQLRPNRATDVLRTMPGVVLTPDRRGNQMLTSTRDGGRGCMEVYLDGSPTMDGGIDIDNQIPAADLAAVEVYTPGNVPAEFTRVGRGTCGAVVVWTKTRARRSK